MELAQRAGDMEFILYDLEEKPLVEGVKQLKYLGRTIKQTDNFLPEV